MVTTPPAPHVFRTFFDLAVDNNFIRNAQFSAMQPGRNLLFPGVIVSEACNTPRWEKVVIEIMRTMKPWRESFFVSINLATLLKAELQTRQPATDKLIDRDATFSFRLMLDDIGVNDAKVLDSFRKGHAEVLTGMQSMLATGIDTHAIGESITKDLKHILIDERKAANRADVMNIADVLATADFQNLCEAFCSALPYGTERGPRLAESDESVWKRHVMVLMISDMLWLASGGQEGRRDERKRADYIDREIVIIGSYAANFHSIDSRTNQMDAILRKHLMRGGLQ